jgi:hypothetical protein
MRKSHNSNNGFSLTECLLAIGTLAVGMLFIAGVFPVGIHFTTVATERSIAAVVADEAFAKIRLYGIADFNSPPWPSPNPATACLYFGMVSFGAVNPYEFAYPSDPNMDISEKQFYWSALCRRVDPEANPISRLVQVTVFVCRKPGPSLKYPGPPDGSGVPVDWPMPIQIGIFAVAGSDMLQIEPGKEVFINDGYTIVDDENGRIYRVIERYAQPNHNTVRLDRRWNAGIIPADRVWVVPPPIGGGRYPCIAIYQRVIRF